MFRKLGFPGGRMVGVIEKDAVTVFRRFSRKHGSEF